MIELKDQMNNLIRLRSRPKRIISLVPSQTELLYDLGMTNEVVGITKFCIHPKEWHTSKEHIGGTKNVNFEKIDTLKPDLIIANKEENTKEIIDKLKEKYPVYISDIYTVEEALQMILDVGNLVDRVEESNEIAKSIQNGFNNLNKIDQSVLYFMWNKPFMVAGKNTFIGELISQLGLTNSFSNPNGRYQEITIDEIMKSDADVLLLSTEPFPFKEKDRLELAHKTGKQVLIVDGEMFSWYGSRMTKMPAYFKTILPLIAQGSS